MFRPLWKKCLLVAALLVAGLTLSANPAEAGWRHWRGGYCGSYGYYPAYAYSYYSPYVSCGWSCYSPCWYPCYSPCYSYYSSPGCCGVVTSSYDGVIVGGKGVEPQLAPAEADAAAAPTPPPPAPEPASVLPTPPEPKDVPASPDVNLPKLPPDAPQGNPAARSLPADAALLSVVVPQDARVYVNGMLTKTSGTHRQYVSYGLQRGYGYTYEVRAVVTRNGQEVSDTQIARVRVGETRDLAFDFRARSDAVVAARLP